jgi:ABC-type transporter Mla subunit MlaD
MDPISLHQFVSLGAALQIGGPILAVLFIWWVDRRDIAKILIQNQKQLEGYREDTKKILDQNEKQFNSVVAMYQNNAELVKSYDKISLDFREVVVANSTIAANLNNAITHNLFCPLVRKEIGG